MTDTTNEPTSRDHTTFTDHLTQADLEKLAQLRASWRDTELGNEE